MITVSKAKITVKNEDKFEAKINEDIANAKKNGLIDAFFYSSVTEKYLTAALASL